ncbi:uncharacterized protein CIMG_12956 [Coccidioides immitis RS]|uniref:Uncharacterized protein n=1 Tax=Coccidioides immitis (strain RS) TaxID=246410 RepID=J3K314_COCIM|nr:uncharacterized protein CIMG_12956 [Coccidioides immitis RS]EAS28529.3 hypothetical protein CIMG_12956 [Coccidioides immitis RS]
MEKMKLSTIQAEISSFNYDLENLEPTDDVSTVVLLWAVWQLIAKSEKRFKNNNPENIYRLLLLLKYVLKQEKDCKQDNKVIISKYANLNAQDDSAAKTGAEAAITAVISKEFQDDIEIDSTDEDVDADFEENINNAVETVNKIICGISSDIPLPFMDKDIRKVLLEEFTKNAVDIEILFVKKCRSDNRLIADAEHLEYLEMSDNNDNNEDSVKNTVEDEILANEVELEKTAQYCTLILKVKEQNVLDSREIINETLKKFIVDKITLKSEFKKLDKNDLKTATTVIIMLYLTW